MLRLEAGVLLPKHRVPGRPWRIIVFTFFHDIRFAVRVLLKNPGFTLIAALSLALGIGANGCIFSLADAALLRPLPVLEPSSVLNVSTNTPDNPFSAVSYPDYLDFRDKSHCFDGMVASQTATFSVATSTTSFPQIRFGVLASDNFFQQLGVKPILGRGFLPEEGKVPGRDAVVVVSYQFWQNDLAHDPAAIGHILRIKGIDFTVVGVTPKSFTGVDRYLNPSLYMPATMSQRLKGTTKDPLEDRGDYSFTVKARLKPGMSREIAQANLATIWSALQQQYPDTKQSRSVAVQTELQSRVRQSPPDAALLGMLMSLVGLVLLIACANVANLLLGRARARSREIALRISLGATRFRLLRQLLSESLVLALIGGSLGLWIGYLGVGFLQSIPVPTDPPIELGIRMDTRVLLFSLTAAVLSALVFGLAPALRSLKTDLVPALKSTTAGSTGSNRTIGRNALVIAQVALSMIVLVVAGMMLDGFHKLLNLDPAFSSDHRLMMEFDPSLTRYTPEQTKDFYRKLVDQTRSISGVRSVSLARSLPYMPDQFTSSVVPEGYQLPKGQVADFLFANIVDEHYFDTTNTPVIRGRGFTADDKEGSRRVAVANEEFAKTYWPKQEPIGKRFRLNTPTGDWVEIIGVTKTSKYLFIGETPTKFLYLPFAQNQNSQMLLLVQTAGDPSALVSPIRNVVKTLDANQPIFNVRTLESYYQQRAVAVPLMIIELVTIMGLLALVLALVGLYGLISYSVSRRTQEIGIRMAIGADRRDVLKMVLRQGLTLAILGVVIGGLATLGVAHLITMGVIGLGTVSPATYVVVPVLLILVTLVACYIPARRASLVDPIKALRYE
jgi:predicted permease